MISFIQKILIGFFVLFSLTFISCSSPVETNNGEKFESNISVSLSIAKEGHVLLYIENSYNKKVATLEDGILPAGVYKFSIDSKTLPDGIYFYTIIYNYSQTTIGQITLIR